MKTQLYNYLLFLSIGLLFGACSKEKIEIPESNNPVFKVEGTMNGESFSLGFIPYAIIKSMYD